MLGNSLGYMATTCMILLVGGCVHQEGSFRTDPVAAAQAAPRQEDYNLELPEEAAEQSGPAVKALIKQSSQFLAQGKPDRAAASLERALTIEPRNAFLYNHLATVRIKQERYAEAEGLAQKSNSLASRNAFLHERNWRLIAQARRQQGDESGAAQAEQRAGQLREFIEQ
ncbi:MAG: tetratricopeptide repeat protein [Nevskiales bacterium]